jgi:AcrR family transcriptional regulator
LRNVGATCIVRGMAGPVSDERIVDGLRRAVSRHGWNGVTLARIAEEAGVSRMTLHRRGLGRDELFLLLASTYEADFRAALWPAVTARGRGLDRLREALLAVCVVTERYLDFLAGLDDETDTRLFHEGEGEVHSREAFIAPVERLLEDGIADGSIRSVPVEETAVVLVNAVDRTYRHLRTAHRWEPARASQVMLDLVCAGLQPAR